jgi:hypothetical protein
MTATNMTFPRVGSSAGRLAGVLGIAIPMIGLIVLPIWRFPSTTASGAEVSAFAADHTAALQAMMLTYTVGVTLWLVFGAAVWARMRSELPADSMLTTCFAAGMISFVTLLLVGFTCFNILVYRQPPPSESKLLYDLTFGLLAMSGMPTAAALGAYAVAVYRHRIVARSTGHVAAAAAAAHVLLLLSFIVGQGFFSLEGMVIAAVPALLWTWIGYTGSVLRAQP